MGKDYFVVVQTIEAGKPVVTVVPHKWVSGNSLFWPSKQANELRQNAASSPASSWTKMPCSVKRKYIPTFKGAEQEADELSGQSTDASDFAPKRKKKLKKGSTTKELDLNHLLTDQAAEANPTVLQPRDRDDVMEITPAEKQAPPVNQPVSEIENICCQPESLLPEGYVVNIQQVDISHYSF
ncbi:uncharacterized protein LOC109397317 [Aedes albopictus]|uniref:Uncharacterized protein n=1 Tax=Aedes albopictus TaxID=7160 RepID=A0ABM1Y0P2_AEDAL